MTETVNTDASQNLPPVNPPFRFPGGSEYRTLNTDIPLSQPLMFYLDGAQTFYLPHEDTMDEEHHNRPQGVIDTLTHKRIFQVVSIRQNQAGMVTIPVYIMKFGKGFDMTGYLIHFEGRDSSGAEIYSDIGFNIVQANLGKIVWSPEAVVAQSPGYYTNCHFVIETPDRSRVLTTLDFSLNIIGNDVAFPKVLAFYSSEYQRALFHIKEMQTSADHQLNYLENMYAAIIADNLDRVQNTLQDVINDLDKNLSESKNKIDKYVSESTATLDKLNLGLTTANGRLDDLEKQITADNLVTTSNMIDLVNKGIAAGQIIMNINDQIMDKDTKDEIDSMYDFFLQQDAQGGNN